jgi:hypothetical protein
MIPHVCYHTRDLCDRHSQVASHRNSFLETLACAPHHFGSACEAIENVNDDLGETMVSRSIYAMGITPRVDRTFAGMGY